MKDCMKIKKIILLTIFCILIVNCGVSFVVKAENKNSQLKFVYNYIGSAIELHEGNNKVDNSKAFTAIRTDYIYGLNENYWTYNETIETGTLYKVLIPDHKVVNIIFDSPVSGASYYDLTKDSFYYYDENDLHQDWWFVNFDGKEKVGYLWICNNENYSNISIEISDAITDKEYRNLGETLNLGITDIEKTDGYTYYYEYNYTIETKERVIGKNTKYFMYFNDYIKPYKIKIPAGKKYEILPYKYEFSDEYLLDDGKSQCFGYVIDDSSFSVGELIASKDDKNIYFGYDGRFCLDNTNNKDDITYYFDADMNLKSIILVDVTDGINKVLENTTDNTENFAFADIVNSSDELKKNILTDEEQALLSVGVDIQIRLDVEDKKDKISSKEESAINKAITGKYQVGTILDINLIKKIGENNVSKVTDVPNGNIEIQLTVPDNIQKKDRKYKVIRLHNGVVSELDVNQNKNILSFETNQFSTYAILFEESITDSTSNNSKNNSTKYVSMYRLYNPNSGEHFYTANATERDNLSNLGWRYEGVAWNAPEISDTPVYRLYNPNAGDHHYTTSSSERDNLVNLGWKYEGIGWYSTGSDGQALYRLYNPNAKAAGAHHYTTSADERDNLISLGWRNEGIAWYGGK
ncbi:MAG: hypothetical protein IJV15_04825 [Lachnospiraceae bacterium]|nr:hypothetical protein [Lachnospiraceae bacterium]